MTYAVLGGGISGLTAAYYLKQFGVKSKIILIEGSNHLGGWIKSCRYEDGTLFELGPRTLRIAGNAGANSLHLIESLKLEDKLLPVLGNDPSSNNRMIKVNNKLHKLPNSLKSLFTKIPPFSKPLVFQLLKDLTAPVVLSEDESFFSFAQRRFGTEIAQYIIDPLCRGVFAGSAKELSAMALGKRVYKSEQMYNSVIKGFLFGKGLAEVQDKALNCTLVNIAKMDEWSVWSLKGGLETLVETLHSYLEESNVEIVTQTQILDIRVDHKKTVITDHGAYSVDKVISCLPSWSLKAVVSKWNPELSRLLSGIGYVSVGLVNLEYPGNLIKEPAFGYLIPSSECNRVLGVIYDSCILPQENKTILTVMMGGYWFQEAFGKDPKADLLLRIARDEVKSTLNIGMEPARYKVSVLKNCIPQYTVGHAERVENIEKLLKNSGIYLSGNSYYGVGVNDAIYSTKKAVQSSL